MFQKEKKKGVRETHNRRNNFCLVPDENQYFTKNKHLEQQNHKDYRRWVIWLKNRIFWHKNGY